MLRRLGCVRTHLDLAQAMGFSCRISLGAFHSWLATFLGNLIFLRETLLKKNADTSSMKKMSQNNLPSLFKAHSSYDARLNSTSIGE